MSEERVSPTPLAGALLLPGRGRQARAAGFDLLQHSRRRPLFPGGSGGGGPAPALALAEELGLCCRELFFAEKALLFQIGELCQAIDRIRGVLWRLG